MPAAPLRGHLALPPALLCAMCAGQRGLSGQRLPGRLRLVHQGGLGRGGGGGGGGGGVGVRGPAICECMGREQDESSSSLLVPRDRGIASGGMARCSARLSCQGAAPPLTGHTWLAPCRRCTRCGRTPRCTSAWPCCSPTAPPRCCRRASRSGEAPACLPSALRYEVQQLPGRRLAERAVLF